MNNTIKIDGIEYNLVPIEKKEEIKKRYKVQDWVVFNSSIYGDLIRKIVTNNDYKIIGGSQLTNIYGDWMTEDATVTVGSYVKPATKEQIETHLIQLAEKKGYDKAKKVRSVVYIEDIYDLNFKKLQYHFKEDALHDSTVTIYKNGKWAEIIKEEEKKFTFGGQEVKITKNIYNTYNIKCKNEEGTFHQLTCIILDPFKEQSFGNVSVKSLTLFTNIITTTKLVIKPYETMVNTITIGCLTGTYKELLNIYNHILELKNK